MTTRALVISDTHGVLRSGVIAAARQCDYIIHAGDFDDEDTFDAIEALGPLCAVRGNNDWYMSRRLQTTLEFTIEETRFFLVHRLADLPRPFPTVDVIVYGHSHRYSEKREGGVLWLNPGSCGRRRFGGELSYVLLTVNGHDVFTQKVDVSPTDL